MILGSGPNRIGQGIEFDYCCCHASFALQEIGFEIIMVNCNPETVSTDYDTTDRLYFEPLTLEDVLNIVETEKPDGVIVQFGGQTPLNLALRLKQRACRSSAPIAGIDRSGRRSQAFGKLLDELKFRSRRTARPPAWKKRATSPAASAIRCWCGPATCWAAARWSSPTTRSRCGNTCAKRLSFSQDRPVLIDQFPRRRDRGRCGRAGRRRDVVIAGIMEHIEEAGVHSGDCSCVLPPMRIGRSDLRNDSRTTPCIWRRR